MDLNQHGRDLHRYLRDIETVIIGALETCNTLPSRKENYTGVWIGEEKIASIGIGAKEWVSYHGFSINVCPALEKFSYIKICGLEGVSATSLSKLGINISLKELTGIVEEKFNSIFCTGVHAKREISVMDQEKDRLPA